VFQNAGISGKAAIGVRELHASSKQWRFQNAAGCGGDGRNASQVLLALPKESVAWW
jgi:hypothetical protein